MAAIFGRQDGVSQFEFFRRVLNEVFQQERGVLATDRLQMPSRGLSKVRLFIFLFPVAILKFMAAIFGPQDGVSQFEFLGVLITVHRLQERGVLAAE